MSLNLIAENLTFTRGNTNYPNSPLLQQLDFTQQEHFYQVLNKYFEIIYLPGGEYAELRHRKSRFFMNTQYVCTANVKFIDVVT